MVVMLVLIGFALYQTGESEAVEVGRTAPDFELTTLDGKTVRLSDFRGKGVLINFWASWCKPCRDEMPAIQRVYERHRDKGLEVLAVNIAETEVPEDHVTGEDAILQTSFDLNAMDEDFRFPQVWTTDLAVDHRLPGGTVLTLEGIYSKDINAVFMRNVQLPAQRKRNGE